MSSLGGRMERRVLHTVHNGGWVLQQHANAIVYRTAQTLKRSTILMLLLGLSAALLLASWIVLNLALHAWLLSRWSAAQANLVVASVNLLVGASTFVAAALMTPVPQLPLPMPLPLRRNASHRPMARLPRPPTEGVPPPLQTVYTQPSSQEDNLQHALGATFELGIQAARTIPQLVRAIRHR